VSQASHHEKEKPVPEKTEMFKKSRVGRKSKAEWRGGGRGAQGRPNSRPRKKKKKKEGAHLGLCIIRIRSSQQMGGPLVLGPPSGMRPVV